MRQRNQSLLACEIQIFFSKSIYVVNVVLDVLLIVKCGDKWERVGKSGKEKKEGEEDLWCDGHRGLGG